MIKDEIRGEYYLLPGGGGGPELVGQAGADTMAHVFVRDAARNRLELWQACRVGASDPGDDFLVEGGREFLRKTVFRQPTDRSAALDVWLRIS